MAWGDFYSEDLLDSIPEGSEATVWQSDIVSSQHRPSFDAGAVPPVPTRPRMNDFTPTGPYTRDGDGIASRFALNPALGAFPSAGQEDDNGMRAGQMHMRNLMKAQKAYATALSAKDPQAAGMAFADLDGMKDGFRSLVAEGWNGKEAAHVIGAVGRVFGGYGNASENARQLRRYAATRGVDIQTAGNELWSLQKNFGAGYLSDYGFSGKVTPDSAHYENIRDNFTDFLSAMWKIEDQYDWQFSQATYRDVFNRCRGIAADLDLSGLSVKGVGAEAIVRAALKENGSLNDDAMLSAPVTDLMRSRSLDRSLVTLAPGFPEDTAGNPFGAPAAATTARERAEQEDDGRDFGLVRSLRQALFRHRAGAVNAGRGANDFTDVSTLRNDFANSFRAFSTGSAHVSDETFLRLADTVIAGVMTGQPVPVTDAVRALATSGEVSPDQADALSTWSRSLMMDTAEGERTVREMAYPFIEQIAMEAGMSMKDPAIAPFVARAYGLVKRTLKDRKTVADLDGLGQEATGEALWAEVRQRLAPVTEQLRKAADAKNAQLARQVEARALANARAKEEG